MNSQFQTLYFRVRRNEISWRDFIESLKKLGDFSEDLIKAIHEQIAIGDKAAISGLVHLAHLTNLDKFAPLFCELLDNYRYDGYMEEVAELAMYMKDERMVPSLIRALDFTVGGDDDNHFNRKLVQALGRIGTPEAIEGLKLAAQHGHELVREEAEEQLRRRSLA